MGKQPKYLKETPTIMTIATESAHSPVHTSCECDTNFDDTIRNK